MYRSFLLILLFSFVGVSMQATEVQAEFTISFDIDCDVGLVTEVAVLNYTEEMVAGFNPQATARPGIQYIVQYEAIEIYCFNDRAPPDLTNQNYYRDIESMCRSSDSLTA